MIDDSEVEALVEKELGKNDGSQQLNHQKPGHSQIVNKPVRVRRKPTSLEDYIVGRLLSPVV